MRISHESRRVSDLLAALDDAAAEVAAGFGVDHSGHVLFGHQVRVELLAAFSFFPVRDQAKHWFHPQFKVHFITNVSNIFHFVHFQLRVLKRSN